MTGMGVGAVFGRALSTLAADGPVVTEKMIREAEWISGISFTDDERKLMLDSVDELVKSYASLREVPLDNGVATANSSATGANATSSSDAGRAGGMVSIGRTGRCPA